MSWEQAFFSNIECFRKWNFLAYIYGKHKIQKLFYLGKMEIYIPFKYEFIQ